MSLVLSLVITAAMWTTVVAFQVALVRTTDVKTELALADRTQLSALVFATLAAVYGYLWVAPREDVVLMHAWAFYAFAMFELIIFTCALVWERNERKRVRG